ncbi:AMP-binding protein [Desulfobulbus rhabdoformis]|uniref:fatty acid CoA ligase family protein n=1 Tax=Desulfobulbus rhabdoformis TaxID=34032 RepID=UPI001964987F|nr:fatty acid CoA ligase family protein [Desulfobulbus rhabdoformis]MBM9613420.1 AMP-binding protein [Desulfobulbus rhabdoformis]
MTDCNIVSALYRSAEKQGKETALTALEGGAWRQWSFSQVAEASEGFAGALYERGVRRGDRVMLMVRPSMDFVCLTFALFQLGAVIILIDPGMGYQNLLRCIGSVKPDILVGISKAIIFSRLFPRPFGSVRKRILVGKPSLFVRHPLQPLAPQPLPAFVANNDDLAAIIFTTGSTGPPKGVEYTHGIFHTQLRLIRDYFGIGSGDIDQPGFPLFGLFATALGAQAVIPDMDPTRPAQVDPEKFVTSIQNNKVSYSFGSPAIWNVVSRYCIEKGIVLPVRKVLMAGAPVPGELVERVQKVMPDDGKIYTPYGATESLPVAAIEGREIVQETWSRTRIGRGACVGRPLPEMELKIIEPVDERIESWEGVRELASGNIGEIVVRGPVVTRAYAGNEKETRMAKITDGDRFWHRMGDMGYLDQEGRLWFCGRKAHRVATEKGMLFTVCCEAIFNEHPRVKRSALVGVGSWGSQVPVLIVELFEKVKDQEQLYHELRELARANERTCEIDRFLIHPAFPVDIRHNAKIFREKLAVWASKRVQLPCG